MILFDVINNTIIDDKIMNIINLVSRPIISLKKDINLNSNLFYESYKESYFDKFCDEFIQLSRKQNLENKEKKLLILSKQKLNELI